jgi:hypothetical protein
VLAVERDDVVVVMHRFQIHDERRIAVDTQGGSGQQRALQAMARALAENAPRRPRGIGVLVGEVVNETLDARRRLQRAQCAQIARREAEAIPRVSTEPLLRHSPVF